jgi:ABC-type multidrug transport system fused ATPase/permease subunit
VRFSYSGTQNPVLDGISLVIPCYSSVGIVGATGTGKTTLVDLILGLLIPTSGQLRVDGVVITGENLLRWRHNVGYVPQNIFLADDTITNNIAFGVPEQEIDHAAVVRAARIANLQEFIEGELPRGYETFVGERGVRLSGGQRQRLGIARALYRDPAMLIMDEATSSLDGVTEGAVNEALHALSGKKTVITIAHRLTTVKACEVIYLLEQGRISSYGSYDELIKTSPWFRAAAR